MLVTIQGLIDNPIVLLQIVSTMVGAFLIVTIFNLLVGRLEKRG